MIGGWEESCKAKGRRRKKKIIKLVRERGRDSKKKESNSNALVSVPRSSASGAWFFFLEISTCEIPGV